MKTVFLDKAVVINVQPGRKGVKVISAMLQTAGVVDYDVLAQERITVQKFIFTTIQNRAYYYSVLELLLLNTTHKLPHERVKYISFNWKKQKLSMVKKNKQKYTSRWRNFTQNKCLKNSVSLIFYSSNDIIRTTQDLI